MSEQAEKRWPSGVRLWKAKDVEPRIGIQNGRGVDLHSLDEARDIHRDLGQAIAEAEPAEQNQEGVAE